jgi:hypothetical protein
VLDDSETLEGRGVDLEESTQLPSDPTSASAARSFVAETLETWGVGTYVLQRAVLLTSEVVTNAIVHARSPVTLVVTSTPATVRIGVRDGSGNFHDRAEATSWIVVVDSCWWRRSLTGGELLRRGTARPSGSNWRRAMMTICLGRP